MMQTALDGKQGIPVSDSAYGENGASGVEAWLNMEEIELDDEQEAAPVEVCATPEELADRYRFMKVLGAGSQGKVYLAERLSDGLKVAIKQLRIDSVKTWKAYTLFHREAEVLASLDVPGVVKLYEASDYFDASPPCSYIVQEYVEGVTLKDVLASGYRFSLNRAYDLILQIIDILKKLHAHNPPVIHRDIKPSNIILKGLDSDRFEVCLIDFGAVSNPKVQSGGSTVAGTFGYMSPEQMIGRATPASDTYALAAMFTYIISGVEPAEMKTFDLRLVIDPYVENHPPALVQTLRRMLDPDIKTRLSDLGELRKRFRSFKLGRYVVENETYRRFSKEEFIERFKQVKHLCQPQNLEIWQELPDLPECREKFPIDIYTNPRFLTYPFKRYCANNNEIDMGETFNKGAVALFIIYEIIMLSIAMYMASSMSMGFFFFWGACFVPMFVYAFTVMFQAIFKYIKNKIFHANEIKGQKPWILPAYHVSSTKCNKHLEMIATGRKTIATITCIRYIRAKSVHESRVETPPTFRIFYKFNPPDDDQENDLIHHVDTHIDPEGRFKVGDSLPILYVGTHLISCLPLHVTKSMPYPFPLDDLELPYDYYYVN